MRAADPLADRIEVHACTVDGEHLMRSYGTTDEQIARLEVGEHIERLTEILIPPPDRLVVISGHRSAGLHCGVAQYVLRRSESDVLDLPAART